MVDHGSAATRKMRYAHAEVVHHRAVWQAQRPELTSAIGWLTRMECQSLKSEWFADFVAAHEQLIAQVWSRCTEGAAVMDKFVTMLGHTAEVFDQDEKDTAAMMRKRAGK